jgi:hypothetical protein
MNGWITDNYNKLIEVCKNISKNSEYKELCQFCIEKFLVNKKVNSIPDDQKLFFFTRIVQNNFNSSSSPYHKIYKKHKFEELTSNIDVPYEEYDEDKLSIDWVIEEVEKIKRNEDWYLGQIFLFYLDEGANLTKLSKRTKIPISNLSREIKKVKDKLNELYKQKYMSCKKCGSTKKEPIKTIMVNNTIEIIPERITLDYTREELDRALNYLNGLTSGYEEKLYLYEFHNKHNSEQLKPSCAVCLPRLQTRINNMKKILDEYERET